MCVCNLACISEEGPNGGKKKGAKTTSERKKCLKPRHEREVSELIKRKPRKILSENSEPKEPNTE